MPISAILDEFNMDMSITRARYVELIKAEEEAAKLKAFLESKLEKYCGVSHGELETLEGLGMIRRAKNVSAE